MPRLRPLPWLPVIAGQDRQQPRGERPLPQRFSQNMGDLAIDHHYRLFRERAPTGTGCRSIPNPAGRTPCRSTRSAAWAWTTRRCREFWAWSWRHRIGDGNRFFVKQPASAAHTYGHRLVLAEGFTTIGPHWQATLWDNLKPCFDKACCEGLNRLVWHAFVCSPASAGMPGQPILRRHASQSERNLVEQVRTVLRLSQPLPSVDATRPVRGRRAYYYGDHVPNFAQYKGTDPAKVLPGFDYDVITADAILNRASVRDGRIVLPDGMSYRLLVLPQRTEISPPVLTKIVTMVKQGATIVGPKPVKSESLQDFPECDAEVKKLADQIWGAKSIAGRVITAKTAREVLVSDGVKPDFEVEAENSNAIDYLHRRDGDTDIYFVANRTNVSQETVCKFRVSGKAPELWDPVSGSRRFCRAYSERDGQTRLPIELAPCGSMFVIFSAPASEHPAVGVKNERTFTSIQELKGPWQVNFDPRWGGPKTSTFETLESWTHRPEPGIKFYSGTATYLATFTFANIGSPDSQSQYVLDLGDLRELAEVRLNGKSCGISWAPPFRVDVSGAIHSGTNSLEVDIVNFWPNRIIGDASEPDHKPFTRTNISQAHGGNEADALRPLRARQDREGTERMNKS